MEGLWGDLYTVVADLKQTVSPVMDDDGVEELFQEIDQLIGQLELEFKSMQRELDIRQLETMGFDDFCITLGELRQILEKFLEVSDGEIRTVLRHFIDAMKFSTVRDHRVLMALALSVAKRV